MQEPYSNFVLRHFPKLHALNGSLAKVSLFFQFFRFGKIANVRIHIGNEASEQNERVWENEIAGFIEILPFIANLEIHIRNGCFVLLLSDQNQRDQENANADFTEKSYLTLIEVMYFTNF